MRGDEHTPRRSFLSAVQGKFAALRHPRPGPTLMLVDSGKFFRSSIEYLSLKHQISSTKLKVRAVIELEKEPVLCFVHFSLIIYKNEYPKINQVPQK